jgi:3-hydroxyisobutyrate dehydrogenase-like beta-hydroxyacid dehydrogenase
MQGGFRFVRNTSWRDLQSRSDAKLPSYDWSIKVLGKRLNLRGSVMKVGFIGLGNMGTGMASNLVKAGHEVTVYNRTAAKTQPLAALGAKVATTIADVCTGDAVVTMLANDQAVEDVVLGQGGVASHLTPSALHISSSTISVELSRRLADEHDRHGQRFVSAPVFGRPDAAAARRLFVVVAGDRAARQVAAPLLEAVGQRVFVMSDKPLAANLVKLSGNFLSASVIESLGEALALISRGGIDQDIYIDFLTASLFDAPVYRTYGQVLSERRFEPAGFAAALGAKDIRLLLGAAEDLRVPMPLASLIHDRFLRLLAGGGERLDWAALGALAARDAGAGVHQSAQLSPQTP